MGKLIKTGSDFSGIGAFDQALKRLNIKQKKLFACELDKYARQTYILNYGEPAYFPENVYDREIPKESLDIYMTSPPCQSFSLAGKRKGEDSVNGILFYNSHHFIQVNKPRYFIFENVKGLLSDNKGNTFQTWCNYLGGKSINGNPVLFPHIESVPYHIYHKVINAKNCGVAQNRERVFIIGIRDDKDNNFTFPMDIKLTKKLKDYLEKEVDQKYYLSEVALQGIKSTSFNARSTIIQNIEGSCATILSRDFKDPKCIDLNESKIISYTRDKKREVIQRNLKDISNTIHSATSSGGNTSQFILEKDQIILNKYPKLQKGRGNVLFHRKGFGNNSQVYDSNNVMGTIDTCGGGGREPHTLIDNKIRRLTPKECFRLMDFPETFKWDVSNTQAYKQAGNTIVVACLTGIIEKLNLK